MKKKYPNGIPRLKQAKNNRWQSLSLVLLFSMTLIGWGGIASAQTVQIGSGVATSNNTPINYNWGYNYSQVIYTSTELINAGVNPSEGLITTLRYKTNLSAATTDWQDWTVYIGNTTKDNFANTTDWVPVASLSEVFNGQIAANVVAGEWLEITLDNSFQWDGTSNLVIAVNETTPSFGGQPSWSAYTQAPTTGNKAIYQKNDSSPYDPAAPPAGDLTNLVAQIQFDGALQLACSGAPTAGTLPATAGVCVGAQFTLEATGSTIGTSGLTGQWQSRLSGSSDPWVDISGATTNPYTIPSVPVDAMEYQYILSCGVDQDISNTMTTTLNAVADCHCIPSATNASRYINDFSTTNGILNITNNGTGFSPNGYGDFTAQTLSQVKGLTVSFTSNVIGGSAGFKIWIDWNHDGVFDVSEVAYQSSSYSVSPSGSFTVPLTALSGSAKMRIVSNWSLTNGGTDPCATGYTLGEFEDYTFEVVVPDAPSITQSAGVPDCVNGTDLTASGTLGANETWYWQTTANGTDMTNDAATAWTVLENGTYYVRTYDANYTIWSDADSIQVTNVPSEGPPTSLAAGQNPVCAPGTQITVDPAPTGVVNYWQGTNATSSVMTDDAVNPYAVTATGTYYVKAYNTTTQCWSDAVDITVTVGTIIPNDPVVTVPAYNYCLGITTAEISAEATYTGAETSLTTVTNGTYACNGLTGGIMFNITNDQNVDITISALDIKLSADIIPTAKVFFKSGTYAGFEENEFAWTLLGDYAVPTGAPNSLQYIDVDDLVIPAGETFGIYLNYKTRFSLLTSTQTYSDGNITITSGNALCSPWGGINEMFAFNGNVYYLPPASTDLVWYDAVTGGNVVGTTNPLETVGTTVLPTVTAGTYEFYAASNFDGCESVNRELVTVNINPVNVSFLIIDATCNNGDNGSFAIDNVDCGAAPFTYSVDGGAFGGIPNNLTTGDHTVIVRDFNGDESAEYTITIGSAAGPSDVVIDDFTNASLTVSWTANGDETSWNIEWGVPGFTPGTGTEIGAAVAGGSPFTIPGLSGYTDYYVYVSANCGGATTAGDWDFVFATTDCDPMTAIGFCESFEDYQNTTDCWRMVDNNSDDETWTIYTGGGASNSGIYGAGIQTDVSPGANDDYLILPMMTLTGNEVLTYFYNGTGASDAINYRVVLSTTGRAPADFTTVLFADTVYNDEFKDTSVNLSAYTGDVYIAFHIPPGSLAGWYLFLDDICVDVCMPTPGVDGTADVCRLDGTVDLNTAITSSYTDGNWTFAPNQALIAGSLMDVSLLPSGAHEVMYIKETGCTSDTTIATINVFNASSAGTGGSITVCLNEPIDLYSALSGNVDMGGDWYDFNGDLINGSRPNAPNVGSQYNYQYISSNGVCPQDTATVEVIVDGSCDYLVAVSEELFTEISVYPNPATTQVNIVNPSNTSSLKVEMLDMNGRVVLVENKALNNATEATLTIDHLEKGIYTLRVYNDEGQRTFKVVKQ